MPAPAFHASRVVGTSLLRTPHLRLPGELGLGALMDNAGALWLPLFTGSIVVGTPAGYAAGGLWLAGL